MNLKRYYSVILVSMRLLYLAKCTDDSGYDFLYEMISDKVLFLRELEDLFLNQEASLRPSELAKFCKNLLQKKLLELVLEENELHEESYLGELLRNVVLELKSNTPLKTDIAVKLRGRGQLFLKEIRSLCGANVKSCQKKIDEEFNIEKAPFNNYVRSVISTLLSASRLLAENKKGLGDFVREIETIALDNMAEYLDMIDSVKEISWGSVSVSFDETDITLTRPGFGIIVLFEQNQIVHHVRDNCVDLLLLKTRDESMHMSVFQVFFRFSENFESSSLPKDLLSSFHRYMNGALKGTIDKINKRICSSCVKVTDDWLILGMNYPSHLTIKVDCKNVSNILWELKEKANSVGFKWMLMVGEELKRHNVKGDICRNSIGSTLQSNGWELIIGYTANPGYETHITLGVLSSNDKECDEIMVEMHKNQEREISPDFSETKGSPEQAEFARKYALKMESLKVNELMKLDLNHLSEYPKLIHQVKNAREGKRVVVTEDVIQQWGQAKIRMVRETLLRAIRLKESRLLRVSRVHGSIINMNRIQNFEPVIST